MAKEQGNWFVSPSIDILFVCGGAVFLLAGCYYLCSAAQTAAFHQLGYLSAVSVAAVLVFGETHTVSTLVGTTHDAAWSVRHRTSSLIAGFLAFSLALALIAWPVAAPLVVRLYLLSVAWHFTRQVYGVVLLYCLKAGYEPGAVRKILWCRLLHLTALNWILVQLSNYFGNRTESLFLQTLPPLYLLPAATVNLCSAAVIGAVLAVLADVSVLTWRGQPRPPFSAILTLLAVCFFFLPVGPSRWLQGPIWLYAPALFHGSQYLCVMGWRLARGCQPGEAGVVLAKIYGQCLVLSLLLFLAVPLLLHALVPSIAYATAMAAVFVSAQLYHMLMDSVIWKGEKQTATVKIAGRLKLRVGNAGGAVMDIAV